MPYVLIDYYDDGTYDELRFDTMDEVERHFDEDPDVIDRIDRGQAYLCETFEAKGKAMAYRKATRGTGRAKAAKRRAMRAYKAARRTRRADRSDWSYNYNGWLREYPNGWIGWVEDLEEFGYGETGYDAWIFRGEFGEDEIDCGYYDDPDAAADACDAEYASVAKAARRYKKAMRRATSRRR